MDRGSNPTLLVFRFSAMGDVAMVASVLREFVEYHPQLTVVMVSRAFFQPFFADIPRLVFHPCRFDGTHRGFGGLRRLFIELKRYKPAFVADLHHNIRSRLLAFSFRLIGITVRHLDKDRTGRKALTRPRHKIMKPLRPMPERYADVLAKLGFPMALRHALRPHRQSLPETAKRLFADGGATYVGIAPFAQHQPKVYPLNRMEAVIAYLDKKGHHVLVFGGGPDEQRLAEAWQRAFDNVHSLIGHFSLADELAIISNLDLMLSMDSAGMHLASLMGIRVLSIWGPTHPYAGFLGYGQHPEDCIQVDHPARPSSIYGNKPCSCDGKDSMELIEPELVIAKLQEAGL